MCLSLNFGHSVYKAPISKMFIWLDGDINRGGSRTAATSKMERFDIIVNGWKPLTIITKRSILDVAAVLDPPLIKSWLGRAFLFYIIIKHQGVNTFENQADWFPQTIKAKHKNFQKQLTDPL